MGLTLPLVVQQAVEAPISPLGLLWMLLLAYLVFTLTLILQRKQAAGCFSLGLATLACRSPLILFFWAGAIGAGWSASRSPCCCSWRSAASAVRGVVQRASEHQVAKCLQSGTERAAAVGFHEH